MMMMICMYTHENNLQRQPQFYLPPSALPWHLSYLLSYRWAEAQ